MSKLKRTVIDDLKREVLDDEVAERNYAALVEATKLELGDDRGDVGISDTLDEADAYDEMEEASAGLAADGCDYICALFWMLAGAGFTEVPRGFILSVVAQIVREDKHTDTDARLRTRNWLRSWVAPRGLFSGSAISTNGSRRPITRTSFTSRKATLTAKRGAIARPATSSCSTGKWPTL